MGTEKCPVCGVSVKKENIKGHHQRVHQKRSGSIAEPKLIVRSTPFFKSNRRRNVAVLGLVVLAVIGVSVAAASIIDASTMKMHTHPKVSATINGSPYTISSQIGIDQSLWRDHSLDQYGMQGMSPLHSHGADGTIHVESNTLRDFTLKEFLAVWGQRVDGNQVLAHPVDSGHRAYLVVDGVEKLAAEDVVFRDEQRIQIVCGP